MSIAEFALSEIAVAQPCAATTRQPPPRRRLVARADRVEPPEAR